MIDNNGLNKKIHLYHQPRNTKKEGSVDYYSLATCNIKNGKNMKSIIQRVGRLSRDEADNYRAFLQVINKKVEGVHLVDIQKVLYQDEKKYLNVLVINELWKKFKFDKLFDTTILNNQHLSTENVARILTINKLLDPSSKTRTIPWLQTTLLPKIMNINAEHYKKTKIFNELPKIHDHKKSIEKFFVDFSKTQSAKKDGVEIYYFDGSTSWFEGSHCTLAEYDLEKTRGFYSNVVGLMLITDKEGFPIAWELVNGHKKDTVEFQELSERVYEEYGVKEITYCFDRAVATVKNFSMIQDYKSKFISGIRDNQIKKIFDLEVFEKTRNAILNYCNLLPQEQRGILPINGFYSSNKKIFFKELGVINNFRYIVSFSKDIYDVETTDRDRRIQDALLAINEQNQALLFSKKEPNSDNVEKELLENLNHFKVASIFEYKIIPSVSKHKTQSYRIECEFKKDKLKELRQTDGLMVFITDHVEKNNTDFKVPSYNIIEHYKDKHVIENAFRELKSFLELRPFFVWKEEHVKAHYDIGIIAYFINQYIYKKLSPSVQNEENSEAVSLREFYEILEKSGLVIKLVTPNGLEIYKQKSYDSKLKQLLNKLGLSALDSPKIHTSLNVYQ